MDSRGRNSQHFSDVTPAFPLVAEVGRQFAASSRSIRSMRHRAPAGPVVRECHAYRSPHRRLRYSRARLIQSNMLALHLRMRGSSPVYLNSIATVARCVSVSRGRARAARSKRFRRVCNDIPPPSTAAIIAAICARPPGET
jgi:hypothetical protein